MATMPKFPPEREIEDLILELVKEKPNVQPAEVIRVSSLRLRIAPIAIREAMWHLISQGELSLSEDQSLTVSAQQQR
jgi:hypothetical protein